MVYTTRRLNFEYINIEGRPLPESQTSHKPIGASEERDADVTVDEIYLFIHRRSLILLYHTYSYLARRFTIILSFK